MKAIVSIKRSDLLLISLYTLPRAHSNYIFMGILGLGIFAFLLFREQCVSVRTVFVAAVASIGGALGGLLGGFAVSTLMMLITVGDKGGVLGVHEYTLSPEGLREKTDANEGLNRWSGVLSLTKQRHHLLIRISSYMFHIIPRRSFSSAAEFEAFCSQAAELWSAAQQRAQADGPASGGSAA
ncbi:YcxB family protein [Sinimarinibacterium flocculans]|uniref:YcxB family protein n=1 Tax=Sinimarinibacterium flocculans TaxID=985250 RepID=UPI000D75D9E9|nr:YcxB family protein [Sinimarinibacterium flocculans]